MEVRVEPWPDDGRKVRVHLQITPFIERPNIEVIIHGAHEEEVASIYIVETIDDRMTFTMHIRSEDKNSATFSLTATLTYPDAGNVAQEIVVFETPPIAE